MLIYCIRHARLPMKKGEEDMGYEEKQEHLEKIHGIRRGDKCLLHFLVRQGDGAAKEVVKKHVEVVGLYPHFVAVRHKAGYLESFGYSEFRRRLRYEGKTNI